MSKKVPYLEDVQSPYLNARREWNERYGGYIAKARLWQIVGLLSFLIAMVSVLGVIYFAGQNKLIPYVIEVDKRGTTVTVYESEKMKPVDTLVIRAQLAQFIKDVRTVTVDLTVKKNEIRRLYTHMNQDSQAFNFLNAYFRSESPFEKAQKKTIMVDIVQLLPLSEKTWQVEWSEQEYDKSGAISDKRNFTATLTISVGNTVDETSILQNPIGMIVEQIHWSADFQDKSN